MSVSPGLPSEGLSAVQKQRADIAASMAKWGGAAAADELISANFVTQLVDEYLAAWGPTEDCRAGSLIRLRDAGVTPVLAGALCERGQATAGDAIATWAAFRHVLPSDFSDEDVAELLKGGFSPSDASSEVFELLAAFRSAGWQLSVSDAMFLERTTRSWEYFAFDADGHYVPASLRDYAQACAEPFSGLWPMTADELEILRPYVDSSWIKVMCFMVSQLRDNPAAHLDPSVVLGRISGWDTDNSEAIVAVGWAVGLSALDPGLDSEFLGDAGRILARTAGSFTPLAGSAIVRAKGLGVVFNKDTFPQFTSDLYVDRFEKLRGLDVSTREATYFAGKGVPPDLATYLAGSLSRAGFDYLLGLPVCDVEVLTALGQVKFRNPEYVVRLWLTAAPGLSSKGLVSVLSSYGGELGCIFYAENAARLRGLMPGLSLVDALYCFEAWGGHSFDSSLRLCDAAEVVLSVFPSIDVPTMLAAATYMRSGSSPAESRKWLEGLMAANPSPHTPSPALAVAAFIDVKHHDSKGVKAPSRLNGFARFGFKSSVKMFNGNVEGYRGELEEWRDSHEVLTENPWVDAPDEVLGQAETFQRSGLVSLPSRVAPARPSRTLEGVASAASRVDVLRDSYGEVMTRFDTWWTARAILGRAALADKARQKAVSSGGSPESVVVVGEVDPTQARRALAELEAGGASAGEDRLLLCNDWPPVGLFLESLVRFNDLVRAGESDEVLSKAASESEFLWEDAQSQARGKNLQDFLMGDPSVVLMMSSVAVAEARLAKEFAVASTDLSGAGVNALGKIHAAVDVLVDILGAARFMLSVPSIEVSPEGVVFVLEGSRELLPAPPSISASPLDPPGKSRPRTSPRR